MTKSSYKTSLRTTLLNEILELRCGYITENMASANLGLIKTIENEIKIYHVFRSMDEKELEIINSEFSALNNNFKVNEIYKDLIWKADCESELLKKYKKLYYTEYSEYPVEEIWHGAIECSEIKNRIEGLDIISIGSAIKRFHTVNETTYISSWIKTFKLLIKFLETIDYD